MTVLMDYRCTTCRAVSERWVADGSVIVRCTSCGGEAKRLFGVALIGHAVEAKKPSADSHAFDCFLPNHGHSAKPAVGERAHEH